jgi:dTDP-4-amino-4,6-dideoxygalactose transaminase
MHIDQPPENDGKLQDAFDDPIYVTRPYLPPLNDFLPYMEEIWRDRILTNGGAFHQRLEQDLCDYLGVEHLALFSNGTLALITALQALRITGEVITTPYTFVATTHALHWHGNKPVFVDIDPDTLNLDPTKIEAAITPQTTAIMPVHCYGNPCDTEAIRKIADNYNLKVIYDACHAFGVKDSGGSILRHGDLACMSFHATKVFNTFEGGAIVCPDAKTKKRIDHLKNFGFVDELTVVAPGINGKMSEINSAFGLLQLQHMNEVMEQRQEIDRLYRAGLEHLKGIKSVSQFAGGTRNYSYFPILVDSGSNGGRDALFHFLKKFNVNSRRYFYPLISDFPMYRGLPSAQSDNLKVARGISDSVLCLPIYPGLSKNEVDKIIGLIRKFCQDGPDLV